MDAVPEPAMTDPTPRLTPDADHFAQPVVSVARRDVATLSQDLTVERALEVIRRQGLGEKVVYFYAVDSQDRLVGVVPTRRLLTAPLGHRLADLMVARVVAIPASATVLEACEAFVLHKFLAFPVVDESRRILGVVDVGLLSEEAFDLAEREQTAALFESMGFRLSQVRAASAVGAFRFRFPWLLATLGSGLACAWLASAYEATLARSIVLAFFLTLVLGLGESVSVQSMTVTIQALRTTSPTWAWYGRALRHEAGTALLLGGGCGTLVGGLVWLWRGQGMVGFVLGASLLLALGTACFLGLSVPTLLHALRLDPKIAAGPVTLALADLLTLAFYFGLAAKFL